ncbi:hypothetical protein D5085_04670 [Ectothiorhodospiraceae bacterium BW-2]|nr:hypothetical protein D5085_04670 [Ectothiorhodospiraceae bacterium BW-2]
MSLAEGVDRTDGQRVLRGGSWNNKPNNLRSANRNRNNTGNRRNNNGFRLILQSASWEYYLLTQSGCGYGFSQRGIKVSMNQLPACCKEGTANSSVRMTGRRVGSFGERPASPFSLPAKTRITTNETDATYTD